MSLSDPIGDMLARIKNAQVRNHSKVSLPSSKFKAKIADVLKSEGYIIDYKIKDDKKQPKYAKNWRQIKDWSWAYKKYSFLIGSELDSIESIDINPTGLIADTDNSNDIIIFE